MIINKIYYIYYKMYIVVYELLCLIMAQYRNVILKHPKIITIDM